MNKWRKLDDQSQHFFGGDKGGEAFIRRRAVRQRAIKYSPPWYLQRLRYHHYRILVLKRSVQTIVAPMCFRIWGVFGGGSLRVWNDWRRIWSKSRRMLNIGGKWWKKMRNRGDSWNWWSVFDVCKTRRLWRRSRSWLRWRKNLRRATSIRLRRCCWRHHGWQGCWAWWSLRNSRHSSE